MTKKKTIAKHLTEQENRLVEQLRAHPELLARFESILNITDNAQGPLKTADEVEELLIEAVRQLGNSSMREWAAQAEHRVGQQLQAQHPEVLRRKKKP